MFNESTRHKTIYTQYKRDDSNLCDIIDRAYEGLNEKYDLDEFYRNFWNIETATGKWLDIWGVIVAIDRHLDVEQEDHFFGFHEGDRLPFNDGIFYHKGASIATNVFRMSDDIFRKTIIAKAKANIATCDVASLNKILTYFFQDRGKCYVVDAGNMTINFVFEFELTGWERALLKRDVFPRPAGVLVNIVTTTPSGGGGGEGGGGAVIENTACTFTGVITNGDIVVNNLTDYWDDDLFMYVPTADTSDLNIMHEPASSAIDINGETVLFYITTGISQTDYWEVGFMLGGVERQLVFNYRDFPLIEPYDVIHAEVFNDTIQIKLSCVPILANG